LTLQIGWGHDGGKSRVTAVPKQGEIMNQFDNVSVVKKANVYFDGKCVSHTVVLPDGTRKSVGVILPAKLLFSTGAPEVMELIDGQCKVTLAGETEAKTYGAGQSFNVPGESSFQIEVLETVHYVCHFG
jgi:uncharacterized protein YaiE (UPF0345 family)